MAVLRQEGWPVNRQRVQHAMRVMGLRGLAPGPDPSRPHPAHRIYPYLLRGVTAATPNHVWGIAVTYLRLRGAWLYLVAVLDWFSRYVVSWELSESLRLPFVLTAAERALAQATPTIWNHDQGRATARARPIPPCSKWPGSRLAWMGGAAPWIASSPSASGGA
jgi:putative transposase